MIKVLVIIVLSFSLLGCNQSGAETSNDDMELKFGRTKLSIPQKYILPGFPSSIAPKEGLDVDDGALIEVPIVDLGVAPQSRGGLSDKLIVLISGFSNQVNPGALSAWNGTGLFDDRIIEFDDQVKLYRVYPKAGYPIVWQYFKASPIEGGDFLSNWVSSCTAPPGTDGKSLPKVKCQVVSRYKTVESQITLTGENIKILDSINEGYRSLLSSWEKPGAPPN
ncbi:hypothetical protein ACJJIF_08940 [Microbulbifer sp. SSSA002]|uniref:hypothetical protein n=1 Tax=Microbulbifer sp. SSSA002 TaxID=3243376 RepID=UPI00403A4E06